MDIQEDISSFIEKIPTTKNCCFCIPLKPGTKLIAILGIFIILTCGAMMLIKDRKYLNISTIILISLLSIFIIITIMFVIVSVLLLVAACDENPELMSYYIWFAGVFLCLQLILAIAIPLVLAIEGKYSITIGLMWMVLVMIIALGWTHFISVVNTYRMSLLYGDSA